jgi:hypothetical protein
VDNRQKGSAAPLGFQAVDDEQIDGVLMVGLPLLRENFTLSLVVALEVCSHVAGDPIRSLDSGTVGAVVSFWF